GAVGAGVERCELSRSGDEGEAGDAGAGHRISGRSGEADGLRKLASWGLGDRLRSGGRCGAVRGRGAAGEKRGGGGGGGGRGRAAAVYRGQRRLGGVHEVEPRTTQSRTWPGRGRTDSDQDSHPTPASSMNSTGAQSNGLHPPHTGAGGRGSAAG